MANYILNHAKKKHNEDIHKHLEITLKSTLQFNFFKNYKLVIQSYFILKHSKVIRLELQEDGCKYINGNLKELKIPTTILVKI